MTESFPALDLLQKLAKQTKPLTPAQRAQVEELCTRFGELSAAARSGATFIDYLLTRAPELPDDNRTLRRLRLALNRTHRHI